MFQDQCISITDLRKNTTKCLQNLEKNEKFIFINNKPVAVIIDINQYEQNFHKPSLIELPKTEISTNIKKLAEETQKMNSSEFINI